MQLHLLVSQLRFARRELVRALKGVSEEDAVRRIQPMNCISWMVGHLANQEHYYWVVMAQQKAVAPDLYKLVGYNQPASTPALKEMWAEWKKITAAADGFLATLTPAVMQTCFQWKGKPVDESIGTLLMRNVYHYWYHIGEASAVRQMLGHTKLPEFVGNMDKVPYRPE